jgi:hypothetical protein
MLKKIDSILKQGQGVVNEDILWQNDPNFGVADGATSLNKYVDPQGKSDGYLAANNVKQTFENSTGSLVDLALKANMKIKEQMLANNIDINNRSNLWSTTLAAVKIKPDDFDWVQLGDSLILVIYKNNSFKLLVENYDHDQETLIEWKKLAAQGATNIREKLREQIVKVRLGMNINYGILNGEENMIKFLNQGTENLKNVKHILIFTDGLIIPQKEPAQPDDFQTLVDLYLQGGLKQANQYVTDLKKSDPNCALYPRFKQFDDVAAIALYF